MTSRASVPSPAPASIAWKRDGLPSVSHMTRSWTAISAPKAGWTMGEV